MIRSIRHFAAKPKLAAIVVDVLCLGPENPNEFPSFSYLGVVTPR
jgi:hypothetical protein